MTQHSLVKRPTVFVTVGGSLWLLSGAGPRTRSRHVPGDEVGRSQRPPQVQGGSFSMCHSVTDAAVQPSGTHQAGACAFPQRED